FFFIIKLVQLWAMCTFFFKYGLKLFLSKIKPIYAYAIVSMLFGLCYPWHTWGFVLTFIIFGFLLCYLTRKTDSYLPGLILLYSAYIFHAGIPWHGALITFLVVYPISIGVLLSLIYLNILKKKINSRNTPHTLAKTNKYLTINITCIMIFLKITFSFHALTRNIIRQFQKIINKSFNLIIFQGYLSYLLLYNF
ncbi:MAG: CPBP family intramembrane metalloprotease, partial [Promethearchaeota archaeon]